MLVSLYIDALVVPGGPKET